MDCRRVEEHLFEHTEPGERAGSQDGLSLPAQMAQEARIERHLDGCSRCRGLRELLDADAQDALSGLAEGVVAQTSGSACVGVRHQLASVDSESHADRRAPLESFPAVQDELLRSHLRHCDGCAVIARVLERQAVALPQLAEIRLDSTFVGEVLERTSRQPQIFQQSMSTTRSKWTYASMVPRWARSLVRRGAARPRLALELAYAGTLVVAVLVGLSSADTLTSMPAAVSTERVGDWYREAGHQARDGYLSLRSVTASVATTAASTVARAGVAMGFWAPAAQNDGEPATLVRPDLDADPDHDDLSRPTTKERG